MTVISSYLLVGLVASVAGALLQVGQQVVWRYPELSQQTTLPCLPATDEELHGVLRLADRELQGGRDTGVVGSYQVLGVEGQDSRVPVVPPHPLQALVQSSLDCRPQRCRVEV